jgi:hypothetical protein
MVSMKDEESPVHVVTGTLEIPCHLELERNRFLGRCKPQAIKNPRKRLAWMTTLPGAKLLLPAFKGAEPWKGTHSCLTTTSSTRRFAMPGFSGLAMPSLASSAIWAATTATRVSTGSATTLSFLSTTTVR